MVSISYLIFEQLFFMVFIEFVILEKDALHDIKHHVSVTLTCISPFTYILATPLQDTQLQ